MVNANDPFQSLVNSIQVALSPLESSLQKAARDLELCWPGPKSKGKNVELDGKRKVQIFAAKKKNNDRQYVFTDDKNNGLFTKVPLRTFFGMILPNMNSSHKNEAYKGNCVNCQQFAITWSLLVKSVAQALSSPLKASKKRCQKIHDEVSPVFYPQTRDQCESEQSKVKGQYVKKFDSVYAVHNIDGKQMSLECLIGFLIDQVTKNIPKFDQGEKAECHIGRDSSTLLLPPQFDYWRALTSFLESRKVVVNGFLGNLNFARVGDVSSTIFGVTSSVNEEGEENVTTGNREERGGSSPRKSAGGILTVSLSNVERLRSTLSTVSLAELIELVPHMGRSSKEEHPDKRKLFSVQDFFRYTQSEGRRFFDELDRDGDGQVTLEDLEFEMRKRKLPQRYAQDFMCHARRHLFFKSLGWKQFLSLMEQKEPTILRAYTSLCLSKSGTLQKNEILESLVNAGLPANEDNAVAMMRFLNADLEGSISYGHFRDFMLLLPSDRLQDDPRNMWLEAATVVAVAPPVEIPTGNVLRSALAGGLSCALSTAIMHPVDTIKTQVQASTQVTFAEIISMLPQIGHRQLYKGSIPAIIGQFSSHGLRTGIAEATKLVLVNFAPSFPDIQVQSVGSFCGTLLGTALRIPCEVLKQRLQAGLFETVGEALVGTWQQDGLKGFFRGTGATLLREVPFYVAGTGIYEEFKKVAKHILGRELQPWETIAVGALSGGLTSVLTTPFDVIKTRMMTAQGQSVSMSVAALSIIHHEGVLGLFKGAVPRFFWIAPLGAMNFAGYELAKKAMEKGDAT